MFEGLRTRFGSPAFVPDQEAWKPRRDVLVTGGRGRAILQEAALTKISRSHNPLWSWRLDEGTWFAEKFDLSLLSF